MDYDTKLRNPLQPCPLPLLLALTLLSKNSTNKPKKTERHNVMQERRHKQAYERTDACADGTEKKHSNRIRMPKKQPRRAITNPAPPEKEK